MECVICFAVAMASVMGNRLCLNIRTLAQNSQDETEAIATRNPMSTLRFMSTFPFVKTQIQSQDDGEAWVGEISAESE